jgi:hypothetical protein
MPSQKSLRTTATWSRSTSLLQLFRIHQTLRVTPTIKTGLTNHLWSLEESCGIIGAEQPGCGGMNKKSFVWWKIVLGAVLILVETKQLFNPGSRALQPSNATQATSMLTVECAVLLLGAWLIFSGLRAKYKS